MNDRKLEELVSQRLKEIYPMPELQPEPRTARPRGRVRYRTPLGVAAAVVVIVGGVGIGLGIAHHGSSTPAANAPRATTKATSSATPSWVMRCLVGRSPTMSTSDRAYLGLTLSQAKALARQRGQSLILVGAGGTCVQIGDAVAHSHTVAVAFDAGDSDGFQAPGAHVVYATSDRAHYAGQSLSVP